MDRLLAMVERPWPEAVRGRPLTARALGVRLGRFGISSAPVRFTADFVPRSYARADFEDAFSRYLAPPLVTTVTIGESPTLARSPDATPLRLVTVGACGESESGFACVTHVTDSNRGNEEDEYVAREREGIQQFGS